MKKLEAIFRRVSKALDHQADLHFDCRLENGKYTWTVSLFGKGALERFSLTFYGRNPMACLRALLACEQDRATYLKVESAASKSAFVREVEALMASSGIEVVSLCYYGPSGYYPKGFFGAYAHRGGLCRCSNNDDNESLRAVLASAAGQLQPVAA